MERRLRRGTSDLVLAIVSTSPWAPEAEMLPSSILTEPEVDIQTLAAPRRCTTFLSVRARTIPIDIMTTDIANPRHL